MLIVRISQTNAKTNTLYFRQAAVHFVIVQILTTVLTSNVLTELKHYTLQMLAHYQNSADSNYSAQ
jgi:hypothetical protein